MENPPREVTLFLIVYRREGVGGAAAKRGVAYRETGRGNRAERVERLWSRKPPPFAKSAKDGTPAKSPDPFGVSHAQGVLTVRVRV